MLCIRKHKALLSWSLVILITTAFSIKGLHLIDEHHHAPTCEEKHLKHLHENHEHVDCLLCDFIFSPFTESLKVLSIHYPVYFRKPVSYALSIYISLNNELHYLRGPPVS